MRGEVAILNVGAGDTKLVFESGDSAENERSAQIVTDMIRRGFVLLIEVGRNDSGPIYQRAKGFDPHTREYIVAGMAEDAQSTTTGATTNEPEPARKTRARKAATPSRKAGHRRIPASGAKAVVVSRTSGG